MVRAFPTIPLIVCIVLAGSSSWLARAQDRASRPDPSQRYVYPDSKGTLVYTQDSRGNRVPDYSACGFGGGGVDLPIIDVRVTVAPPNFLANHAQSARAHAARVQSAIDYVAKLPLDERGFRGAVLLKAGDHPVSEPLRITASGIVIRGESQPAGRSRLIAVGNDRRAVLHISGENALPREQHQAVAIVQEFVPCGSRQIEVADDHTFRVGEFVSVVHPSTAKWISAIGMDRFPTDDRGSWLDWKPGSMDVRWSRQIVAMHGSTIELDAPLTMSLDRSLGECQIRKVLWPGRIEHVGVEHLDMESEFDPNNLYDEEHAWDGIQLNNVRDAWVRDITFRHFAGSAVIAHAGASRLTISGCRSAEPISEIGGLRRRIFFVCGEQTLVENCSSSDGINDFCVGYLAAGPNAFVRCSAHNAHGSSGPVESWASGVLLDNVHIDGGALRLTNLETDGQGVGWSAANCMLWQSTAPRIECRRPPLAENWAIGCWGGFLGDGHWRSMDEFVDPKSLYDAQLSERRIAERKASGPPPRSSEPDRPISIESLEHTTADEAPRIAVTPKLRLENGWLVNDLGPVTGRRLTMPWWRGKLVPELAAESGPAITRFVPGRSGRGYSEDLADVIQRMTDNGQSVLEHHWGLWYDRRRDDHEMIRRLDGDVWGPFYEQPWARSGQGRAWDGLSKYDLEKFNIWYFSRLQEFADLAAPLGIVLLEEMYFQHNILEAGAHWADFPWRSANCLQATGFVEPPPYENAKRIFQADNFYDVLHPQRRELHQKYIRHCLDTLADRTNVIFSIGEEFTGPLHFVQFWLATIDQWSKETGRQVLVCLSCTKDVQDAILADPVYNPIVDIIEMKYWWYTGDGTLYAPPGGQSLAPRQQFRLWRGNRSRSETEHARQILEYRQRFPDKAVMSALSQSDGWGQLLAGCSFAPLPTTVNSTLRRAIAKMVPAKIPSESSSAMMGLGDGTSFFFRLPRSAEFVLPSRSYEVAIATISANSGKVISERAVRAGEPIRLTISDSSDLIWIRAN